MDRTKDIKAQLFSNRELKNMIFHKGILKLFYGSIEVDVMKTAITYLLITALSFPFLGIYNSGAAVYRSIGKTNVTMYVSILMNIINIVGNAIGIFVLNAGVVGVAVPTLLSRIVAGVLMMVLTFNKKNSVYISWRQIFSWNKSSLKRILKIAVPNGIENSLFSFGKVIVTGIVATFGTAQIAANGVANSVSQITIIVVNAISLAMITVIGQCIGADDYDQAVGYTKKLMKISYISTIVIAISANLLLHPILSMFELSAEAYSISYMVIIVHNLLAIFLHPLSFNLPNSLRAAGDVSFTMYIGVLSMIIVRLGAAIILGKWLNMGVMGVWLAMFIDWFVRSMAFTIRFKSGKWKTLRVI